MGLHRPGATFQPIATYVLCAPVALLWRHYEESTATGAPWARRKVVVKPKLLINGAHVRRSLRCHYVSMGMFKLREIPECRETVYVFCMRSKCAPSLGVIYLPLRYCGGACDRTARTSPRCLYIFLTPWDRHENATLAK